MQPNAPNFDAVFGAVKDSGIRTRAVMYIIIILLALEITMVRNYVYPNWTYRIEKEDVFISRCMDNADVSALSGDAKAACEKDLRIIFGITSIDELKKNSDERNNIERHTNGEIDTYIKSETFQIPIFGIYLHENDAWIVTGLFNLVAMMLLNEFMKRELENISTAKSFIVNEDCKFLMISTQIFASPKESDPNTPGWFLRRILFVILYFLPFLLHLSIFLSDTYPFEDQFYTSEKLLGGVGAAVIEMLLEASAGVLLAIVAWKCSVRGMAIDDEIRAISKLPMPTN